MKKMFLVCAALLALASTTMAQEWAVSTASEGLKGPVRSVHWIKVDSSTCKWHGCVLDPPTLIESEHLIYDADGLLLESSYNNSRNGSSESTSRYYDKKRRLTQIVQMGPIGNCRWDFNYDGKRVQTYTFYSDCSDYSDNDTVTFRCHYDRSGNLLSVTEEGEDACPCVYMYENGFLVTKQNGTWHTVYARNPQGRLLKHSSYQIEGNFDEHGEWKCRPADTATLTYEYFYTSDGDMAEVRGVEYGREKVTSYRYLEYDSYGNWTRRKVTYTRDKDNVEIRDEIRMISYYTSKP